MKDPAEMTTAEYATLASSGQLPRPEVKVEVEEVPAKVTGPTPIPD